MTFTSSTGAYNVASTDDVVILSTAQSLDFGVTNAYVISATTTQIVVHVYVWKSSTLVYLDNAVFVAIDTP